MADQSEGDMILVTGASGYIATNIVQRLLLQGSLVRGTVRSLKNEKKIKPLHDLCPDAKHPLQLVEADLMDPDCWDKTVEGCTYVLHTASPFLSETPQDENELIKPAVDGTLSVLRACHKHRVKRVVLTSSIAAVSGGWGNGDPNKVFTEEDWTDTSVNNLDPYIKSKTLAEKAAWDFQQQLPDDEKFELAVINPSYVMGPVLCGGDATSMEIPRRLMQREMPMLAKLYFQVCDVRDVADAHIKAITIPEADGKRHIIASKGVWVKDMALVLNDEFKDQGYSIPTVVAPNIFISLYGVFNKTIRMVVPFLGQTQQMETSRMRNVLGIPGTDWKKTVVDMAYSLVEKGFVKRTSKYRGMPSNM